MKEQIEKIKVSPRRLSLLSLMGLACSFLGASAYGDPTPYAFEQSGYADAGTTTDNVHLLESDPETIESGSIFATENDGIRIIANGTQSASYDLDNPSQPEGQTIKTADAVIYFKESNKDNIVLHHATDALFTISPSETDSEKRAYCLQLVSGDYRLGGSADGSNSETVLGTFSDTLNADLNLANNKVNGDDIGNGETASADGSGKFLSINGENMKTGDEVWLSLGGILGDSSDSIDGINVGDYNHSFLLGTIETVNADDKELTLVLNNDSGVAVGATTNTVQIDEIKGNENLNLRLFANRDYPILTAETNIKKETKGDLGELDRSTALDTKPDFIFNQDTLTVNKLILGIEDTGETARLNINTSNDDGNVNELMPLPLLSEKVDVYFTNPVTLSVKGIELYNKTVSRLQFQDDSVMNLAGDVEFLTTSDSEEASGRAFNLSIGSVLSIYPKNSDGTLAANPCGQFNISEGNILNIEGNVEFQALQNEEKNYHNFIDLKGKLELNNSQLKLSNLTKDQSNGDGLSQLILASDNNSIIQGFSNAEISANSNYGSHLINVAENASLTLAGPLVVGYESLVGNGKAINMQSGAILTLDNSGGTTAISQGELCFSGNNIINFNLTFDEATQKLKSDSYLSLQANATVSGNPKLSYNVKDFLFDYGTNTLQEYLNNSKATSIALIEGGNDSQITPFGADATSIDLSSRFVKDLSATVTADGSQHTVVLNLDNINDNSVVKDIKIAYNNDVNWAGISDDFCSKINTYLNDASDDSNVRISSALRSIAFDNENNPEIVEKALRSMARTTTEEKNRATLQVISSARNSIYNQLNIDYKKKYNVWASLLGGTSRQDEIGGYKMDCDVYGFTVGADTYINDQWLLGAMAGYAKADATYKGKIATNDGARNKCHQKAYFGGIYGKWSSLLKNMEAKFSVVGGKSKYNEGLALTKLETPELFINDDVKHNGHWISANADFSYKPWEICGFNLGPWASLTFSHIKQNQHQFALGDSMVIQEGYTDMGRYMKTVDAAKRRSVEVTLGIAADYKFDGGAIDLNLGIKHEFRKSHNGDVTVSFYDTTNDKIEQSNAFSFTPSHDYCAKDAVIARAAFNAQYGNVGLSIGTCGQVGNHFKDIAGSITASYSF